MDCIVGVGCWVLNKSILINVEYEPGVKNPELHAGMNIFQALLPKRINVGVVRSGSGFH